MSTVSHSLTCLVVGTFECSSLYSVVHVVFSSSQSKFDKVSPGYQAAVEAAVKAAGKSETQSTASELANID